MTAKPTYHVAGGHPSNFASWVRPVRVSQSLWPKLAAACERRLTPAERDGVIDLIELQAHIVESGAEWVSTQQIKATLSGLSNMPAADVGDAFRRADDFTKAHIATALHRIGVRDANTLIRPSPQQIVDAARSALTLIRGHPGKRARASTDHFARALLELWAALDERSRPMPDAFAAPLFKAVGISIQKSERSRVINEAARQIGARRRSRPRRSLSLVKPEADEAARMLARLWSGHKD